MKRAAGPLWIIILFGAIALFLSVQMNWHPFTSFFSEWKLEKTVIESGQDANQNPDIIQGKDGCFRLYAHGTLMDGKGMMSIYSYHSCDGMHWKFEGKRIERAAMPAAILMDDGSVRLYFQRSVENDKNQALMTAISADGLHFKINETPLLVTGRGELKEIKTIAHFELIKLENGYRMYFDEGDLTPMDFKKYKNENWSWPIWRIRSLFSEDGLHWNLDPGVRIEYEQEPLRYMQKAGSCTVIKEDDMYHMYFDAGFSPWEDLKWWKRLEWSGIYEAVSDDGLQWKIIDRNILRHGSDPKIIKMGNKIRMYVSEGHREESNSIESYAKE